MLYNQNIICISSIDWDFVWQGHQEIMSAFTKNGNRVLFIENTGIRVPGIRDSARVKKRLINWFRGIKGFREITKNLYIYSPVILPFPYSRLARWINRNFLFVSLRKWVRIMNFRDAVIWTFLPSGNALDMIDEFDYKCLVYYCIADFDKLADIRKVRKTENVLIRKSDIIFAQGRILDEKCRKFNNNVHIFPFGVNINIFDASKDSFVKDGYADIRNIKKPIIGYIGGIHRHIDFNLLKYVAQNKPEWSVVMVGPIQTDTLILEGIPNVIFLGQKDFKLLPGYIEEFDVCIIPYSRSEYTDTVYPTKLNEYHALGKPVVVTDLPELVAFNQNNKDLVFIAKTKEEFITKIMDALEGKDTNLADERKKSAKLHSWDIRIEEMSNLIEEAIKKKKTIGYSDWQKRFRQIYRVTRRKFVKATAVLFALWALVFYTPFVWLVANPLKISMQPQKADAIVVLAGGTGESGQPKQGYEERVRHAVELYKGGYADRMIFSSGYKYEFEEPRLMKMLAVYLGVPDNLIILEQNALSTYQNIKFVKEILDENKFKSILLVSSPYHMRRVWFVARKIAPGLKIIYSPIPNSKFYLHPLSWDFKCPLYKQINLRQIKSLMHEYAGIIYYWWKGYI